MIAWWPLDETAGTAVSDALGQNHGTASDPIGVLNGPKSAMGLVGNGLIFFAQGRVTIPNSSGSLDFEPNKSFTVDAWIKGHTGPIVSNYNISTKLGYSLLIDGNNTLRFDMGTGSVPMTWNGPPITPNAWTFVAVVVDRTSPAKTVTLYTSAAGILSGGVVSPPIPNNVNAGINLPLIIGGCPGNAVTCTTVIDEVEIFNRALTKLELQKIVDAGPAGKCKPKGMTWRVGAVNATNGTVTVGCGSSDPNPCNPTLGDHLCTDSLPLLCFKPSSFPVPQSVNNTDIKNRWSGGIVGTTPPVQASSFGGSLALANARCVQEFVSTDWRVAEFHDGWGWNFQAYGNVGKPTNRFWVHINDQPNGTCFPKP
jgi:hypothetical protein